MIRRPPRSTQSRSSAASDVYKRQILNVSYALFKHVNEASTDEVTKNMSEYLNENAPELKLDAANNTIQ